VINLALYVDDALEHGGMLAAQALANGGQGEGRVLAAQVKGGVAGQHGLLAAALGLELWLIYTVGFAYKSYNALQVRTGGLGGVVPGLGRARSWRTPDGVCRNCSGSGK